VTGALAEKVPENFGGVHAQLEELRVALAAKLADRARARANPNVPTRVLVECERAAVNAIREIEDLACCARKIAEAPGRVPEAARMARDLLTQREKLEEEVAILRRNLDRAPDTRARKELDDHLVRIENEVKLRQMRYDWIAGNCSAPPETWEDAARTRVRELEGGGRIPDDDYGWLWPGPFPIDAFSDSDRR
jgi:hypothetical protein